MMADGNVDIQVSPDVLDSVEKLLPYLDEHRDDIAWIDLVIDAPNEHTVHGSKAYFVFGGSPYRPQYDGHYNVSIFHIPADASNQNIYERVKGFTNKEIAGVTVQRYRS